MTRKLSSHRLGLLITIATALAYSIWPAAMRAVYANDANLSFVILFGMLLRCTPLLITSTFQRRTLFKTATHRRQALTGGFFQAISSAAALAAVAFLPGPLTVVIMFTHTLMLLAYMIWRGEVKADKATILATLAALAGLVFVLDLFHKQTSTNLMGMAFAFVSAIAIASRLYVIGHQTKSSHPVTVGAENSIFAILFTPLILLYQMPHGPTPTGYAWMAFGCLGLGFGTLGQFYAISLLGSFRYSLFLKMEPLFATIFAALLIGEYLKPVQYFGILMVIGSLVLYQLFENRRNKIVQKALDVQ